MTDVLTAVPGARAGLEYVELLVNGVPLDTVLRSHYVPILVTNQPSWYPTAELRRILGELPSPLEDGRVPLLVCSQCGDLGCGAVTAVVEHGDTTVTWRDFAVQYDYAPLTEDLMIRGEGPYVFDRDAYRGVLQGISFG